MLPLGLDSRIPIDAFVEPFSIQDPLNLHGVELLALFRGVALGIEDIRDLLERSIRICIAQLKDPPNGAGFLIVHSQGLATAFRLITNGCLAACIAALAGFSPPT